MAWGDASPFFCPDRERGGPLTHHHKQPSEVDSQQNRGFLQRLKDVFWKPEEEAESKVEEIKTDAHKTTSHQ